VSTNVASFVGATTVRIHELGYADREPTPEELERMRALVRQAMEEGALGVGSSLIYAPGVLREDAGADRARAEAGATAACTSRTCAAKATRCSRRSTS
jgi:N-acyl-D-aspartate/D-glutamate deacylase